MSAGKWADYVYVASSWRNPIQPAVCAALRSAGIDHYDFKNPEGGTGFSWKEVKTGSTPGLAGKGSDWEQVGDYLSMVNPLWVQGGGRGTTRELRARVVSVTPEAAGSATGPSACRPAAAMAVA